jgi:hypothetical protein
LLAIVNLHIEFALNLLWAGMSLALLFGIRQRRFRGCTGEFVRVVAALSLIFVLFPIISITDDLNSAPAVLETRSGSEIAPQTQHSSGTAGALVLFLSAFAAPVEAGRQYAGSIPAESAPHRLLTFTQSRRPPPINSI